MADTLRVHRDPDYFPLESGLKLSYRYTSTEFDGEQIVEILIGSVDAFRDEAVAHALMTRLHQGRVKVSSFKIRRSAKELRAESGVLGFARKEFPRPAVVGKQWVEEPDRHEIRSLDATIETPAGRFARCLRVDSYLAGGDGGSAIRYYAPGVGYVYEEYSSESWGARVALLCYAFPDPRRKP